MISFASSLNRRFAVLFLLALSLPCFAQHLVKSVAVGTEPRGVGVNPRTGRIYVANVTDGTISVLGRGTVVTTIPVDTLPFEVAVNPLTNRIYAAGCNFFTGEGSTVVVIDGSTNRSSQISSSIRPVFSARKGLR